VASTWAPIDLNGKRTKPPRDSYYAHPQTGELLRHWPPGKPDKPGLIPARTSTTTHEGTDMGLEHLEEPPTTDADYLGAVAGIAEELEGLAPQVEEYLNTCAQMGFGDELEPGHRLAELLTEAAAAAQEMGTRFAEMHEGVREHAASGKKVIGTDFYTGEGA
jgi:hypothetical protein